MSNNRIVWLIPLLFIIGSYNVMGYSVIFTLVVPSTTPPPSGGGGGIPIIEEVEDDEPPHMIYLVNEFFRYPWRHATYFNLLVIGTILSTYIISRQYYLGIRDEEEDDENL